MSIKYYVKVLFVFMVSVVVYCLLNFNVVYSRFGQIGYMIIYAVDGIVFTYLIYLITSKLLESNNIIVRFCIVFRFALWILKWFV